MKEYNVHAGFVLKNKLLKFICHIKARIVNYFYSVDNLNCEK